MESLQEPLYVPIFLVEKKPAELAFFFSGERGKARVERGVRVTRSPRALLEKRQK